MELERGRAVISMSGRDKGHYMAVISVEPGFAYVVDGNLRKIERPKRKNQKHLSVTGTIFDSSSLEDDKQLRKAILDAFGSDHR